MPRARVCPKCGAKVSRKGQFCASCGQPLPVKQATTARSQARKKKPKSEKVADLAAQKDQVVAEPELIGSAIFEEPLSVPEEELEPESIATQELLNYLGTMRGLVYLLREAPQYKELLSETFVDATRSVFLHIRGREELTSEDEAVKLAIKALEQTCRRHNIPLPPECHETNTQDEQTS